MSLSAIVRAVGGDLYANGLRAVIPGPGHSRHDRSVSLLLSEGRLVVHSFGRSNWREVLDALRTQGLVDALGRPSSASGAGWTDRVQPSPASRTGVAARLWDEAASLRRQLSLSHIRQRHVERPAPVSPALRHHSAIPIAVYSWRGPRRPALLAAIRDRAGGLCGVELTYLDGNGARASGVAISRKVIGVLPPACAVRLDVAADELLVGEGVFTTLSASARFGLPGWALLSAGNLRSWAPPQGVRKVLIAADRGLEGERSARLLQDRLCASGVQARVALPPVPAGDWNEAASKAVVVSEERGRAGMDAPSGRMVRSPTSDTSS